MYNKTLKCRQDARDTIDVIVLDNIDGRQMKVGCPEDKEDEPVYEGGDLDWGTIATTVRANENIYCLLGEVLQLQRYLTRVKESILHLQIQVWLDPNRWRIQGGRRWGAI